MGSFAREGAELVLDEAILVVSDSAVHLVDDVHRVLVATARDHVLDVVEVFKGVRRRRLSTICLREAAAQEGHEEKGEKRSGHCRLHGQSLQTTPASNMSQFFSDLLRR